jgi:putative component of toxin-antitoxin plasmid stabilization module
MILVLLCGGSKSSQTRDITRAKKIAQELKDEGNG